MLAAFTLALGQIGDARVLRILAKCLAITLALFAVLGVIGWWSVSALLAGLPIGDSYFAAAETARRLLTFVILAVGGWLLWRIVALAVLQFFADDVVAAVEARHYPQAFANARPLGWRQEALVALGAARRALVYNLLALPLALILLLTGVGAPLVFLAVNAALLGRELTEMVWLRHSPSAEAVLPLGRSQRFVLGGIVALLFAVPFANLLAPILGAAMATHLVHRKGVIARAP